MKINLGADLPLRALLIGLAAIAPTAFPAAQAGYSTLHELAYLVIIPAAVLLIVAWALLRRSSAAGLAALIRDGAVAGALATVALEGARYSGFRMGFMPGNLPELMGVLLSSFALGPTCCVHSRRVCLSFLELRLFRNHFHPRAFQFASLVGDSLRGRCGRGFPHQSRGPGIRRWHFGRQFWVALRCHCPHGPPCFRFGVGLAA